MAGLKPFELPAEFGEAMERLIPSGESLIAITDMECFETIEGRDGRDVDITLERTVALPLDCSPPQPPPMPPPSPPTPVVLAPRFTG